MIKNLLVLVSICFLFCQSLLAQETYLYSYTKGQHGQFNYANYGIEYKPLKLITSWAFYDFVDGRADTSYVSKSRCEWSANLLSNPSTSSYTPQPMCLDIEAFNFRTDFDNATKQLQVAMSAYRSITNNRLGFYSVMPSRDYWNPVQWDKLQYKRQNPFYQQTKQQFRGWQELNSRHRWGPSLASQVDIVYPSLYPFYDNLEGWKTYADYNLEEAKKYGKPTIAWLWTQYHTSNAQLRGQYVGDEYLRAMIQKCVDEQVEGVVFLNSWTAVGSVGGPMPESAIQVIAEFFGPEE